MLRLQSALKHGRQRLSGAYKITKIGAGSVGFAVGTGYLYAKFRPLNEENTGPVKRIDNEITRFLAIFGMVEWLEKDIQPFQEGGFSKLLEGHWDTGSGNHEHKSVYRREATDLSETMKAPVVWNSYHQFVLYFLNAGVVTLMTHRLWRNGYLIKRISPTRLPSAVTTQKGLDLELADKLLILKTKVSHEKSSLVKEGRKSGLRRGAIEQKIAIIQRQFEQDRAGIVKQFNDRMDQKQTYAKPLLEPFCLASSTSKTYHALLLAAVIMYCYYKEQTRQTLDLSEVNSHLQIGAFLGTVYSSLALAKVLPGNVISTGLQYGLIGGAAYQYKCTGESDMSKEWGTAVEKGEAGPFGLTAAEFGAAFVLVCCCAGNPELIRKSRRLLHIPLSRKSNTPGISDDLVHVVAKISSYGIVASSATLFGMWYYNFTDKVMKANTMQSPQREFDSQPVTMPQKFLDTAHSLFYGHNPPKLLPVEESGKSQVDAMVEIQAAEGFTRQKQLSSFYLSKDYKTHSEGRDDK